MKIKIIIAAAAMSLAVCSCKMETKMTKAEYSGEDLTKVAKITKDKYTKRTLFSMDRSIRWELYGGSSVDGIDFSKPLAQGKKSGEYELIVPDSVRYYYQLVTPKGNAILSERHLPMAGGYNFRDMGGLATSDGRYVKWGRIFRSDDLYALTKPDLEYLSSIPVVSIVDFRADEEVMRAPDMLPESVEGVYAYSISPGNLMSMVNDSNANPSPEWFASLMEEMNRMMVTDEEAIDQYRKFFALLANDSNMPLMFHCSAGKDRTGLGAALILLSLGVDEDTVMEDYLSSNIYLADKYAAMVSENPSLRSLMEVRKEYLQAGIDQIKQTYGSVNEYLRGTLGVDIELMKDKYLY